MKKRRFKKGIIKNLKKCKHANFLKYRSSYEKTFIEFLEESAKCEYYLYEQLKIPYTFYGKAHNYIPDFIIKLSGKIYIIEVKPESMIKERKNQAKFRAVKEYLKTRPGWGFKIITENFLNSLNTVKKEIIQN